MSLWASQLQHKWMMADVALFAHPGREPLRGEHCQPPPLPDLSLPRQPAVGQRHDSHVVRAAESVHREIKCVRAAGCHPAWGRNPWPLVVLQESPDDPLRMTPESPAVVSLQE